MEENQIYTEEVLLVLSSTKNKKSYEEIIKMIQKGFRKYKFKELISGFKKRIYS